MLAKRGRASGTEDGWWRLTAAVDGEGGGGVQWRRRWPTARRRQGGKGKEEDTNTTINEGEGLPFYDSFRCFPTRKTSVARGLRDVGLPT